MNKFFILGLFFSLSLSCYANACTSDYNCSYGNKCVKASGDYGQGVCVKPVDSYGNRDYNVNYGGGAGPTTVEGCSYNTDCDIGFSCMKRSGSMRGICMK